MEEARQYPALTRRALIGVAAAVCLIGCGRAADAVVPTTDGNAFSIDAIKAGGPDEWHRYAMFGNWDYDDGTFAWIAVQPQCDRATALTIFWKSEPDYYLEFKPRRDMPEVNRKGYDLVMLVRDRWVAGRYVRAELAFSLTDDYAPVDFVTLERRYGAQLAQMIPVSMRQPLAGRRLTQDGRGYPGVFGGG